MRKKQIEPLDHIPDEVTIPSGAEPDPDLSSQASESENLMENQVGSTVPARDVVQMTAHQRGQHLAARFKDEGIHPILIFGARAAGKTSLLVSLFQYIHTSSTSSATLSLDLDAIPNDTKDWQDMRLYATKLFERRLYEFMDGQAAPANTDQLPFFIPVKLSSEEKECKFAFLEGMGEWYMPDENADSPHRPFKGEVEGMLRSFNEPLTVLYVAPFTTDGYRKEGDKESPQSEELKRRDLGLFGSIAQYQQIRLANYHIDHHLFMLTKWDIRCNGIGDRELLRPNEDIVEKVIQSRYPLSFSRFRNMNFGATETQKTITHYCAGVIDGQAVMKPAEVDQKRLDFFPRKLWNWFYFNATRVPLYEDVHPKPPSFTDKLIRALRGG